MIVAWGIYLIIFIIWFVRKKPLKRSYTKTFAGSGFELEVRRW